MEAVGVKLGVKGEDARDVAQLGQGDQAGIGEIHACGTKVRTAIAPWTRTWMSSICRAQ